jgi:RND family efflux transporter MFP subunit
MQRLNLNIKTLILSLLIIIISTAILTTAPTQELLARTEKVLSVSVIDVSPQAFTPNYQAYGRTESPKLLTLTAQVEGEIIYVNEAFVEGGQLNKGDIIYQIDNSDFQNKLNQSKSELKIAQANLQLELGEQKVAEREYNQIRDRFSKENLILQKSLLLRIPQLEKAKASVAIAQSNVRLAEKNLQRCKVISNGDYTVLVKGVYHGGFVNKGDNLGELAQLSTLRISLAVPIKVAAMLKVNQNVVITGGNNREHYAFVSHISPNLHEKSQLQQIYLSIVNHNESFILGEFITAYLNLTEHKNTLKIPLSVIENETLWVVNHKHKLLSKKITVIWQNENYAIINNNLTNGELVVKSKISGAINGMTANIVKGIL